jgi:hypothetical protein
MIDCQVVARQAEPSERACPNGLGYGRRRRAVEGIPNGRGSRQSREGRGRTSTNRKHRAAGDGEAGSANSGAGEACRGGGARDGRRRSAARSASSPHSEGHRVLRPRGDDVNKTARTGREDAGNVDERAPHGYHQADRHAHADGWSRCGRSPRRYARCPVRFILTLGSRVTSTLGANIYAKLGSWEKVRISARPHAERASRWRLPSPPSSRNSATDHP